MRHRGRITHWKDNRGFGFITPDRGGRQVFVHIKSFSNRQRRPSENDVVSYDLTVDSKGRLRAVGVAYAEDPVAPARARGRINFPLALATLFLVLVAVLAVAGVLPFAVPVLYLAASIVAFTAYAIDKSAAKANRWRTPENTLHFLSLIGGWPGALTAQKLLHHKSTKPSFQVIFWVTVVLNCVALVWLFSTAGNTALRSLLGAM